MAETKTTEKAPATDASSITSLEAAAAVFDVKSEAVAPLEKGSVIRFRAVFGDIFHPWDNTKFSQDAEVKHAVDDWINLQYTAGKLAVAD